MLQIFVLVYLCKTVGPSGSRPLVSGWGCYPSLPQTDPGHWLFKHLFQTLPAVLLHTGSLTQIAFNCISPRFATLASQSTKASESRRGNFAGTLKISACISFFEITLSLLLPDSERVYGHLLSKPPLVLMDAVLWLDTALFFVQALALPSVRQTSCSPDGAEQAEGDEIYQNGSYELLS